jgi:hypothetical protein
VASAEPEPEPAPEPPETPLLDPMSPLPPGAVMRLGTTRMRFRERDTEGVAFTRAGRPIALEGGGHRGVVVRDLFTDRVLLEADGSQQVAIAPDASFMARTQLKGDAAAVSLFGVPGAGALWTVNVTAPKRTLKLFRKTSQVPADVRRIVVSPNGSHLAIVFSTGDVTLMEAKDGAIVARMKPRTGDLRGLSRDGASALFVQDGTEGGFRWRSSTRRRAPSCASWSPRSPARCSSRPTAARSSPSARSRSSASTSRPARAA